MKIADSIVQLTASHERVERHERREHLEFWRSGEASQAVGAGQAPQGLRRRAEVLMNQLEPPGVEISAAAKALQPERVEAEPGEMDPLADLEISLLKLLVERFTGKELKVYSPNDLKPVDTELDETAVEGGSESGESIGFGLVYDFYESHYEAESTHFSAEGAVRTEDGREINFQVSMNMSREFLSETSFSLRAGEALKDSLVLNFNGSAAELGEADFHFDLDLDGREDQIAFVRPGSGFLALDRNGDGKINDGGELFGPTSGNGFIELAAFDEDGNRWIDENDSVYDRLRIWTRDGQGNDQLMALGQKGVGAIYLGNVDTPFELNNSENQQLGQIRSSGVFLEEEGGVGTIQQLDLVV